MAWFLVCLSRSDLRNQLAFKGGTALKRCYFEDYRFSEDLDFTLCDDLTIDKIREGLEPLFAKALSATGITFRLLRAEQSVNTITLYVGYEGPLPGVRVKEVKVDITIRELVVFGLREQRVLRAYEEYADLPEGESVLTYALEEIGTEKVMAILDPGRNEPRDLYDIWQLCEREVICLPELIGPLEEKLKFRGKSLNDLRGQLERKEDRYRLAWAGRLEPQMVRLEEFDGVYRNVRRRFREAGLQAR